jgi:hypothetical protein
MSSSTKRERTPERTPEFLAVDPICQAVEQMMTRDEDGNLLNEGLNELESRLFLKIQSEIVIVLLEKL